MTKRPRRYTHSGFVILNPYGDVWTNEVYDAPEDAEAALREFWKRLAGDVMDCDEFKIVPGYSQTYAAPLASCDEHAKREDAIAAEGRSPASAVGVAETPLPDRQTPEGGEE